MAYNRPEEMPPDLEELDKWLSDTYIQGSLAGKRELRDGIKEFLTQVFFGTKGNERRADPNSPKTAAALEIMERLYAKFEDGSL